MVDCGEGTQLQMRRTYFQGPPGTKCIPALKMSRVRAVLITHLHGDHCFGLFGLLTTISMQRMRRRLVLVGPTGLEKLVTSVLSVSGDSDEELALRFIGLDPTAPHELELELEGEEGEEGLAVHATPLQHSMPALGYILLEKEQPRELDARKAMGMGAKGKELGLLRAGQDVTVNDMLIRSEDVLLPAPRR